LNNERALFIVCDLERCFAGAHDDAALLLVELHLHDGLRIQRQRRAIVQQHATGFAAIRGLAAGEIPTGNAQPNERKCNHASGHRRGALKPSGRPARLWLGGRIPSAQRGDAIDIAPDRLGTDERTAMAGIGFEPNIELALLGWAEFTAIHPHHPQGGGIVDVICVDDGIHCASLWTLRRRPVHRPPSFHS
jgi:hypothetical protein